METVFVAGIVAITSMFGPLILAMLTNKQRRAEKQEDYKRQDAVAEAAKQAVTAVNHASEISTVKLDAIHALVNSNLTAVMKAELDATVRELRLMKEVIRLNRALGQEPTGEVLQSLAEAETNVSTLKSRIETRESSEDKIST